MTVHDKRRRPFQLSLRSLFVVFVVFGLLFVYAGMYYRLRTRGMEEAKEWGLKGFYYVPIEKAAQDHDLGSHYRLMFLFAPANFVDRNVFGGPHPGAGIMWGLE